MIMLFVVAVGWLGLLTIVLGMLAVGTRTPAPGPLTSRSLAVIADRPVATSRPERSHRSPRRSPRAAVDAA
jgi:hypothetical protein